MFYLYVGVFVCFCEVMLVFVLLLFGGYGVTISDDKIQVLFD